MSEPAPPRPLYKTTVVIWSDFPGTREELTELARRTECGNAYLAAYRTTKVGQPETDPDWDGTDFFDPPNE